MAAIDEALAGLEAGKIDGVAGAFIGDGQMERVIDLGFQPIAVLLELEDGYRPQGYLDGGLAVQGGTLTNGEGSVSIVSNGFRIYGLYDSPYLVGLNRINNQVHYAALRK